MPTERYLRLPDEKKQVICNAALEEFARVPFDKASINKIIQNANISRGSFYTYFEDKQDVLLTVCADRQGVIEKVCKNSMTESGGDLFKMALDVFGFFIDRYANEKLLSLARNIMSCQDTQGLFARSCGKNGQEGLEESVDVLWDYFDHESLVTQTREEFISLYSLVAASLAMAISQYYKMPQEIAGIRHNLVQQLEIIKFGALKTEKRATVNVPVQ